MPLCPCSSRSVADASGETYFEWQGQHSLFLACDGSTPLVPVCFVCFVRPTQILATRIHSKLTQEQNTWRPEVPTKPGGQPSAPAAKAGGEDCLPFLSICPWFHCGSKSCASWPGSRADQIIEFRTSHAELVYELEWPSQCGGEQEDPKLFVPCARPDPETLTSTCIIYPAQLPPRELPRRLPVRATPLPCP